MENHSFIRILFLLLLTFCIGTSSCKEKAGAEAQAAKVTYTCPMHPQIVKEAPGTCPICGMDLVVFDRNNKDESLSLHESQVMLADIRTTIPGEEAISNTKQLNGRLVIDPEKTFFISSRVNGRIELLFVKETGVEVSKGQQLYRIYSEELAALQQEYLVTHAQLKQFPNDEKFREIEKGARQKLMLYGQTPRQINELIAAQKTQPYVTYTSPASGIVAEITAAEGQYINEGGAIMRIENYDHLWVEADVYRAEASDLKKGQEVTILLPGMENEPYKMKIEFINPVLANESQLLQVRGSISNNKKLLKPGMQATVLLPVQSTGSVLSLPSGAVIRDGNGTHAWVEVSKNKFEPRRVTTGIETAQSVEITEGLEKNDKVVISGAYLLYSEYLLKKGANPLSGHNH